MDTHAAVSLQGQQNNMKTSSYAVYAMYVVDAMYAVYAMDAVQCSVYCSRCLLKECMFLFELPPIRPFVVKKLYQVHGVGVLE